MRRRQRLLPCRMVCRSFTSYDGPIVTDIALEPAAKKAEEPAEELPEVDEATVGQLSEEVCLPIIQPPSLLNHH